MSIGDPYDGFFPKGYLRIDPFVGLFSSELESNVGINLQIAFMKEAIVRIADGQEAIVRNIDLKLFSKLNLMEVKLDLVMIEIKSYHHDYLTNKASLLRRTNSQLISGSERKLGMDNLIEWRSHSPDDANMLYC